MLEQTILTVAVCFGVGLGLAHLLPVAHASKCDFSDLELELDTIEGDMGDMPSTTEQEFWTKTAYVNGADAPTLRLFLHGTAPFSIELEPR